MTDTKYYSRTYSNGEFTYIIEDDEGWLDVYREKKITRNILSNVLSFMPTFESTKIRVGELGEENSTDSFENQRTHKKVLKILTPNITSILDDRKEIEIDLMGEFRKLFHYNYDLGYIEDEYNDRKEMMEFSQEMIDDNIKQIDEFKDKFKTVMLKKHRQKVNYIRGRWTQFKPYRQSCSDNPWGWRRPY